MYHISLRANTTGINVHTENKPFTINELLKTGLHCWVDVWYQDGRIYLGKDSPTYLVKPYYINMYSLWCNAMTFETLLQLKKLKAPNYFMYTGLPVLTNRGYIISSTVIPGHESNTIIISDDRKSINDTLAGVISNEILSFL